MSADRIVDRMQAQRDFTDTGSEGSGRLMPRSTYAASLYENNKYNVKGYSYPEDLMAAVPDYGENRVIFYVNTSIDSKIYKSNEIAYLRDDEVSRDMRSDMMNQKITKAQATSAAAAAGAVGGALGGKFMFDRGAAGAGAGAVVGAGGAQLLGGENAETAFSRPQRRLSTAIALTIPNNLSVRYSAGWESEDTMGFQALAKGAEEIGRAISGNVDVNRTGGLAKSVLQSLAISGDFVPFGKEMGIGAGLAANPKKEQAFKSVDFRTFTFDYDFAPKTETEAKNVQNIIRAFKYHMHPEFKDENNFIYIYPSEFDIVYYNGPNENLNIHRHTSCVLTEMTLNYAPNGVFTTFQGNRDVDGMPTHIKMSLTFKELMLLSKEAIERYA